MVYKGNYKHLKKASIEAKKYYTKLREEKENYFYKILRNYQDQNFLFYMAGIYDGDGNHTGTSFILTNSDPKIIRATIKFSEEVVRHKYTTRLNLHGTHNKQKCMSFWEEEHVRIDALTQVDSRKQKRNYNAKEHFGTVKLYIRSPLGINKALAKYSYR